MSIIQFESLGASLLGFSNLFDLENWLTEQER